MQYNTARYGLEARSAKIKQFKRVARPSYDGQQIYVRCEQDGLMCAFNYRNLREAPPNFAALNLDICHHSFDPVHEVFREGVTVAIVPRLYYSRRS